MIRRINNPLGIITAFVMLLASFQVHASLVFTLDRIDDENIIVTGSGQLDGPAPSTNDHILYFDNTYSSLLGGSVNNNILLSSDLDVGTQTINAAFSIATTFGWDGASSGFYIFTVPAPQDFSIGDGLSAGSLEIKSPIAGTTWAPVGSTGAVYWGAINGELAGEWSMIGSTPNPVPVPAAVWLFGTALIGLVGFSRRGKTA